MSLAATLRQARVLAILRRPDIGEVVIELFDQLYAAGVRAVEVTLDQADAVAALERLVSHAPADVAVGAGTVLTPDLLDATVAAGAAYAVCPHLDAALVERGLAAGLPVIPGVATATEVLAARNAGAEVLKLFPAGPLGIAYLRALRGPFPDVAFLPTGGIKIDDVPGWLDAGAVCVGLGSGLVGADGVDPRIEDLLGAAP
jgi:2-dehydro-3-deoxyphosphogluconate aldolase / (4S)-4-hydroxy-2-oxoglutarate aldolase